MNARAATHRHQLKPNVVNRSERSGHLWREALRDTVLLGLEQRGERCPARARIKATHEPWLIDFHQGQRPDDDIGLPYKPGIMFGALVKVRILSRHCPANLHRGPDVAVGNWTRSRS